ncbi:uncharacterized protein LOC111606693 [Tachysurus ichikawai]
MLLDAECGGFGSLSELTRQIAPPVMNGHAPPPTESRKSYQSVNPFRVRAGCPWALSAAEKNRALCSGMVLNGGPEQFPREETERLIERVQCVARVPRLSKTKVVKTHSLNHKPLPASHPSLHLLGLKRDGEEEAARVSLVMAVCSCFDSINTFI